MTDASGRDARMVVLNKIDTLWDSLSTPEQVALQIERQRTGSASVLGLPERQVMALSAQKGLVAKVTGDDRLLRASRLIDFEHVLSQTVMHDRHQILKATVAGTVAELCTQAGHALQAQRRELAEQRTELNGLRGKNASVINHMRLRIEHEQAEFGASLAKIQAVRSVHLKLMREVFDTLGASMLKQSVEPLKTQLRHKGLKIGARKAYGEVFQVLRANLGRADRSTDEMQVMLTAAFRQLNTEFGFSLQIPNRPDLVSFARDLNEIERNHLQYLGVGNSLRLAQEGFAVRLLQALMARLRAVFESALDAIEMWNKSANAQLDRQLRDRRLGFARRVDAIGRIQQAAGNLEERIGEIEQQEQELRERDVRLIQLTTPMLDAPAAGSDEAALRRVA